MVDNAGAKQIKHDFLFEGASTGMPQYKGRIDELRNLVGGFSPGGGAAAGGASPLADRMRQISMERMGDLEGSHQRNMPLAFAAQNAGYQGVADQAGQIADQQKLYEDLLAKQRTAKRKAFQAQMRGLAGMAIGAGAGAMVGGPAGAQFGGQMGAGVGGLLG